MALKKSSGFKYKERTAADVAARVNQSGSMYDSYTNTKFATFRAKEGKHTVRIMPPTWSDEEDETWGRNWGIEVYVHGNVGPENGVYLCLNKMLRKRCPVCEKFRALTASGDTDEANAIKVGKRVVVWIVDRDDEAAGPIIWAMPAFKVEREIQALSTDEDGGIIRVDNPDEGFDISFSRQGAKLNTNYVGVRIARSESPLADDAEQQEEWLKFITENPLPSVLHYYDAAYIDNVLNGQQPEEDELDKPAKKRAAIVDEDDDTPAPKKKKTVVEEDEDEIPQLKKRAAVVEDDDEPEPPKKKRPAVEDDDEPAPAKKKRPVLEDDEAEPAPKKKRPVVEDDADDLTPPKKRAPVVEDDEDDRPKKKRAVVEEEEEDDEPPKKKGPSEAARGALSNLQKRGTR